MAVSAGTSTSVVAQPRPAKRPERSPGALRESVIGRFIGSAGISLCFHAIIATLFGLITWAVGVSSVEEPHAVRAQIVAAELPKVPGGGFRFAGHALIDRPDSSRAAGRRDAGKALSDLLARDEAATTIPDVVGGASISQFTSQGLRRDDLVPSGAGGSGEGGAGSGLGDRDLAGGGPVGSLWGVGEGQKAHSIVYVLDRSGSMSDTFHLLQRELKQAIGSLEPDQHFNVIWFNEGKSTQMFPQLALGTLENKRQVFAAIERIVPSGQTEPVDAIRAGLDCRPDVLFLLSDGDFGEYNQKIMRTIRQKNKDAATTINTILFVYDTAGDGERVLRTIADENRGIYKHVRQEDLRP